MNKVVCSPRELIPKQLDKGTKYFAMYARSGRDDVGYFASTLREDIQNVGICPTERVWDFNTIALAVVAADRSLARKSSADGWTREIDLTVHLCNPDVWIPVSEDLQKTLKFLTGDFWYLTFKDGGITPPPRAKKQKWFDGDCICLLSGGVDSLVGAIDLTTDNRKPIFISQTVRGDAETQKVYAKKIRSEITHLQWSHKIQQTRGKFKEYPESSTRGRSVSFFSFAALAASAIETQSGSPVKIYVPENGFISLNIPLNPGRIGSLSTKTTHPVYLGGIQNIWNKLNFNFQLDTPYKFKTKGEMLSQCRNKKLLYKLIARSTSCGRYNRHGYKHCGRCVPCMVRRAAFLNTGIADNTIKGYKFYNLAKELDDARKANDVMAMATACLRINQSGIKALISGNLSFADHLKRKDFEGVASRGFKEIEFLLQEQGII